MTSKTGLTPAPEHTGLELKGNSITGTLACTGNCPAPVNDHQPNRGSYTATAQCAGL